MLLILALLLTFLMITVMCADLTRYIIPNWLVGLILLCYPALLFLAPAMPDWKMALVAALGAFVIGFILFILKIMGGGDVKLLAVLCLFTGLPALPEFIMGVGLFGGALALLLVVARPFTAYMFSKLKNPPAIPRVLTVGEPVPYGIAIAISFLILLWSGKIPGLVL